MKLITVSRQLDKPTEQLVDEYRKRLKKFNLEILTIKPFPADSQTAKTKESEQILKKIPTQAIVVLLDERGKQLSSPELSVMLSSLTPSRTIFIIGGPHGVDDSVHKRANYSISLSKLTLPHRLALILFIEQLYRAETIISNHPYHHG